MPVRSPASFSAWSLRLWIRNIVLGLVVLAFVIVFGQSSGTGGAEGAVAEVDGERIGRNVFEHFRSGLEAAQRDRLPDDADPAPRRRRRQLLAHLDLAGPA